MYKVKCLLNKNPEGPLNGLVILLLRLSRHCYCLPAAVFQCSLLHGPRTRASRTRVEGLVDVEVALAAEVARTEWASEALGFGRFRELTHAGKARWHYHRWILPQFSHKDLQVRSIMIDLTTQIGCKCMQCKTKECKHVWQRLRS